MHVGQQLVDRLIAYGVRRVFGVPGGQTLPLYDGITRRPGQIAHVLMRSETSAAYAADAYARVTGKVGVCDATVGAGTVHLVPGLVEAFTSSVPVLAVVGDIPRQWSHRRRLASASQGFEQDAFLKPCVKHYGRVEVPESLNHVLQLCLRTAVSGRPGPAVIELPVDLFVRDASARDFPVDPTDATFPRFRPGPDPVAVGAAAEMLVRALRPVIVAGGGAVTAGCSGQLAELAEGLRIPVASTVSGKGILPETHAWSIGVCGSFGTPIAREVLAQADCVLWIGTKAGQGATFDWKLPATNTPGIHIDIDPNELGRNYRNTIPMHGDARASIVSLRETIGPTPSASEWKASEIAELRSAWWDEDAWHVTGDKGVSPQVLFAELRRHLRDDDLVVADASLASGWAASRWQGGTTGRIFLAPRGMAGLGWGLPAAIGAAFARRDQAIRSRRVVCLAGDGGWAYSLGELETVARFGLDVKAIVLNNRSLAWTKHGAAEHFGPKTVSQDFGDVDFATVARGLGCKASRVHESSEIADCLEELFAVADEPTVLDVLSSPSETPVLRPAALPSKTTEPVSTGY